MGAASTTSTGQPAAGLVLLAWGLFASVIGLGLLTDYRGFAQRFTRDARASSEWLRRIPPWKWIRQGPDESARRVMLARLIAVPFAVVGPIMTVVGVVQILRGHVAGPRGPALPLPFALAFIAIAVIGIGQNWRPRGFFRFAARQGGWRLAAAIITSVGAVSFGVFTALGLTTLGILGWLVGGLAAVSQMLVQRQPPEQPQVPGDSPEPPRGSTPVPPQAPATTPGQDEEDDAAFRWL